LALEKRGPMDGEPEKAKLGVDSRAADIIKYNKICSEGS